MVDIIMPIPPECQHELLTYSQPRISQLFPQSGISTRFQLRSKPVLQNLTTSSSASSAESSMINMVLVVG
jgi:hypothetical protein